MKRRHNRKQVIDFVKKVRSLRKDVALGADIIASFLQNQDMFRDSINLIKECKITHLHVSLFKRENILLLECSNS